MFGYHECDVCHEMTDDYSEPCKCTRERYYASSSGDSSEMSKELRLIRIAIEEQNKLLKKLLKEKK